MQVKIRKNKDGIFLVDLKGALDLYSANQFKELIMKMIESKIERFIVNFSEVDSINSSGVGALVFVSSTLKKLKCPLVIIAPEGPTLNALEVTGLKAYFTFASSIKEAITLAG
jgi:anti-sigma B factor antagonist